MQDIIIGPSDFPTLRRVAYYSFPVIAGAVWYAVLSSPFFSFGLRVPPPEDPALLHITLLGLAGLAVAKLFRRLILDTRGTVKVSLVGVSAIFTGGIFYAILLMACFMATEFASGQLASLRQVAQFLVAGIGMIWMAVLYMIFRAPLLVPVGLLFHAVMRAAGGVAEEGEEA